MLQLTKLTLHPMVRGARLAALGALALPAALLAQTARSAPPKLPASAAAKQNVVVTITTDDDDPWVSATHSTRSTTRISRLNVAQLDRALLPYRVAYRELTPDDRRLVRQAFMDLLPGEQFARYRLNLAQARAMVFLAIGPVRPDYVDDGYDRDHGRASDGYADHGNRDDHGDRADRGDHGDRGNGYGYGYGHDQGDHGNAHGSRDDHASRRVIHREALDSMSREADWIHTTILSVGRTGSALPHDQEAAALDRMIEYSRQFVANAPPAGCPEVGDDADRLLTATREAKDFFARSTMPIWMSVSSVRVQNIAQLSDGISKTLVHCMSGTD